LSLPLRFSHQIPLCTSPLPRNAPSIKLFLIWSPE
jgi:hypothetical protein